MSTPNLYTGAYTGVAVNDMATTPRPTPPSSNQPSTEEQLQGDVRLLRLANRFLFVLTVIYCFAFIVAFNFNESTSNQETHLRTSSNEFTCALNCEPYAQNRKSWDEGHVTSLTRGPPLISSPLAHTTIMMPPLYISIHHRVLAL